MDDLYGHAPPEPPIPPVEAVSIDVGLGKTRAWRENIVPNLTRRGLHCTLAVPRHRLGEEIVKNLTEARLTSRVYRGREADDPERPGVKMCRDLERAKLIEEALGDISMHACQHGDHVCEFLDNCGYQRQRRQRPHVWIVPHHLLFRSRPDFIPEPDSLAIDESFWSAALHGIDEVRKLRLSELVEIRDIAISNRPCSHGDGCRTADILEISKRVLKALAFEPEGPIRRATLIKAEITADDLRLAHRLEWMRKRDPDVYPGMPMPLVRKAVALVQANNKGVANLAGFWKLLLRTLEADVERSPWLSIRRKTPPGASEDTPAVHMAWRDDIHESWTAATLVMDATLPVEIVKEFFPQLSAVDRVSAPMPNARVRQIIDRPMSANMLVPARDPDEQRNSTRKVNVERVRRFIKVRANQVVPRRVLVVCQQGLEAQLVDGPLPETVDIAHFNAITGLNDWKDVAVIIVIGRTEPHVRDVERIAGVLFNAEVQEVEPHEDGDIHYPRKRRGIRMRDGRGIVVDGPCHPDPRVEAVRWAICEAELIQAIGRARGVNRTEANPLEVDILTNVCLSIEVDVITTWKDIQPDAIDVMCAASAVPVSYRDMADAYPDLFPSADAARMSIKRINSEQTCIESLLYKRMFGVSVVGYRRKGSRGPAGKLFYIKARIDPVLWLTARLGECALLPATTPPEQPRDQVTTDQAAATPAVSEPVREFEEDVEERIAIMTIDGGLTEEDARAALGLLPALPSYFGIVEEVTGGRYPGTEDWLLATSVWMDRCRRETARPPLPLVPLPGVKRGSRASALDAREGG